MRKIFSITPAPCPLPAPPSLELNADHVAGLPDDPETHALWGHGEETTRGTINLNRPAVVLVDPTLCRELVRSAAGGDWTSSQRINTFTAVTGHAPAPDWQAHQPAVLVSRETRARLTSTSGCVNIRLSIATAEGLLVGGPVMVQS